MSLRIWFYCIVINVCFRVLENREWRLLFFGFGGLEDSFDVCFVGEWLEIVWLQLILDVLVVFDFGDFVVIVMFWVSMWFVFIVVL